MAISTRYNNNPSVRRADANARAIELASFCETQTQIIDNERHLAYLDRELSRAELDRIARFETYILANESADILTPRASESMDRAVQLSAPAFVCDLCPNPAVTTSRLDGLLIHACATCAQDIAERG